MMIDLPLELALSALVLSSFWMLFVLTIRKPVSRWLGARWAYYLWLVPVIGLLALANPTKLAREQFGFPEIQIPGVSLVMGTVVSVITDLDAKAFNTSGPATGFPVVSARNLLIIWVIGSLVSLLMLIVGSVRFSKRVGRGSRLLSIPERSQIESLCAALAGHANIRIRINASDSSPAIVDLFRPLLLLPKNFFNRYSTDQQILILQHELQHLCRHDLAWLHLARIYRCLFWFNPLVYLV